jgi:uncharacterized protein YggE
MAHAPHGPLVSISAYGETHVAPDMATISLGVVNQAPTAAEAMRANAQRMSSLVAAIKRAGGAERDIQTSGVSLSPQYVYKPNTAPELTGYQASNTVRVIVRDLGRLGSTIDAAVGAGGNEVSGVSFGLRDPQTAEDAARLEAVRRLQAKAQLYAQALGKKVHAIRSLSEGGGYTPGPIQPMARAMAMAAPSPATVTQPGELDLRVDVTATFELEP